MWAFSVLSFWIFLRQKDSVSCSAKPLSGATLIHRVQMAVTPLCSCQPQLLVAKGQDGAFCLQTSTEPCVCVSEGRTSHRATT